MKFIEYLRGITGYGKPVWLYWLADVAGIERSRFRRAVSARESKMGDFEFNFKIQASIQEAIVDLDFELWKQENGDNFIAWLQAISGQAAGKAIRREWLCKIIKKNKTTFYRCLNNQSDFTEQEMRKIITAIQALQFEPEPEFRDWWKAAGKGRVWKKQQKTWK